MLIVEGKTIRNYQERMNNDELEDFCAANPDWKVERDHHHNIIIMPPVGGTSGAFENLFSFYLTQWAQHSRQKGIVFSSSTGFLLPNGAMRSPDAAWLSASKWRQLDAQQQRKFVSLVPEFVVEIQSPSDNSAPAGNQNGRMDCQWRTIGLAYRPDRRNCADL